jgi:hypothetical protein
MNRERIAKMTDNVMADMTAEAVDNVRVAASAEDDDPLAMVDQAIDTMIAATQVIDDNLPKIKTETVPQKAAVDAVTDLMETAVKPYLADIVTAMKALGE